MSPAWRRGLALIASVFAISFVFGCTTRAPFISGVIGLPASIPAGSSVILTATGGPGSSSGLWYWRFSTTRNSSCGGLFTSTTTPNDGPADPITIGPTSATTVQVTYTGATAGPCTFTIELITSSGRETTYTVSSTFTGTEGFTLTVSKAGTGSGTVTSDPAGIDCGSTCTANFAEATLVILTATPDSDSTFNEWTGCDSISGDQCTVTMNTNRTVTAAFSISCSGIVVSFPDPGLQQAVREAIDKPTGDITDCDVAGLTELDASHRGISDLTGIDYAVNLVSLDLSFNSISDISLLAGLTNLTRLVLWDNNISDLSALSNLINLNYLDLDNNSISDVTPLSGLTSLTELYVDFNPVSDVTPLTNLTNLTILGLYGDLITDISPLAGLVNLQILYLGKNAIADISPLAGLVNLQRLYLDRNNITDITPLAGLTSLIQLNLQHNDITDITPLGTLTSLTTLYLHDNKISDISPLAGLTNLTLLWLGDNSISNIGPVAALTNLTVLYLYRTMVSDISPLAGLTSLTRLNIQQNNISDMSPLAGLTNLTYLVILTNHKWNGDLSPLAALINLQTLYAGSNHVRDLTPLVGLTNLTYLSLSWAEISDIHPLVINSNNGGLSSGDTVDITCQGGPEGLDITPGSQDMQDIEALQANGVNVIYIPQWNQCWFTLTISLEGTGNGTVTSNPPGIDCGSDCQESYEIDRVVTLTAVPDADSVFAGWGGDPDCSDGQVTMNEARTCTATFNLSHE